MATIKITITGGTGAGKSRAARIIAEALDNALLVEEEAMSRPRGMFEDRRFTCSVRDADFLILTETGDAEQIGDWNCTDRLAATDGVTEMASDVRIDPKVKS